jgi:putative phosphoribosyl transferase
MKEISIPVGDSYIKGDLTIVPDAQGLVVFAHGSGSSRLSTRNRYVAEFLNLGTISTFLFDLLTPEEDEIDQFTRQFRFDIPLLAERLVLVTQWLQSNKDTMHAKLGYFGASTGAAAALIAAAQLPEDILAVVSRGGRPDLAGEYLKKVKAATLLIVGEMDTEVIILNELAYKQLHCIKEMYIVPKATHLFEEAGTLEEVSKVALEWFMKYLKI